MKTFAIPGIATPASALCLGTSGFGSALSRDDSFALLDEFAARGGTFLDTAHIYAAWLPGGVGASERTIGEWLASRGARARMLVATKGGHPELADGSPHRLRPEDLAQDLRESLERLRVDAVDLYWLHRDDRSVPVGEILSVLSSHLGAGRIRAIGASNWRPERLQEAADWAAAHHVTGFVASSIGWSLARTVPGPTGDMVSMDDAQLAWYRASGLPVVAYSSQATGYFVKAERPPGQYDTPDNAERRARVVTLARQRNASANAVALAWMLAHPCSGCAVIGPRSLEQLRDSLGALAVDLDADTCRWLDLG